MIHPCVYAAITSCKNLGRIFTSNKSIWSAMFSWRSHFGHFSFVANIFFMKLQASIIFTMASYLERWFHGRYEIRSLRLHIPKGARFCLLEMHNQISAAWPLWTESRDRMLLACCHGSNAAGLLVILVWKLKKKRSYQIIQSMWGSLTFCAYKRSTPFLSSIQEHHSSHPSRNPASRTSPRLGIGSTQVWASD